MTVKLNRETITITMVVLLAIIGGFSITTAVLAYTPNSESNVIEESENSSFPNSSIEQPPIIPSDLVILGLDESAWTDMYNAASALEKNAQQVMNAVFLIRKGSIENIAFTTDQLNSLRDQGLSGMVRAADRYSDLKGIIGITESNLIIWEASNSQPIVCYNTYQATGCP